MQYLTRAFAFGQLGNKWGGPSERVLHFLTSSVLLVPLSSLQSLLFSLLGAGFQALAVLTFAQAAVTTMNLGSLPSFPGMGLLNGPREIVIAAATFLLLSGIAQYLGTTGIYDVWKVSQSKRTTEVIQMLSLSSEGKVDPGLEKVGKAAQTALVQSGQSIRLGLSAALSLAQAAIFAFLAFLQFPGLGLIILVPTLLIGALLTLKAASRNALSTKRREALHSSKSAAMDELSDPTISPNSSSAPTDSVQALDASWTLLFQSLKRAARIRAIMTSAVLPTLLVTASLIALEMADEDQSGTALATLALMLLAILQVSSAASSVVLIGRFSPSITRYQYAMKQLSRRDAKE